MNVSVFFQSLKQMGGIIALEHRYHGNLPDIRNCRLCAEYSLPFKGKWVVVNGGISKRTSHSWDIPTQRYAYDFVILDAEGKSFHGPEADPSSFYCYGKDILAPAGGVVAEVSAGQPDSRITARREAVCDARDIRGNYILLFHAENEHSLLAHLKPGSILVSVGQTVKRGQKIAQCGNSGNTSEPHLHFQLQQGRSFYTSPGLPIQFADIYVQDTSRYEVFDDRGLYIPGKSSYPPYIEIGQTVSNQK